MRAKKIVLENQTLIFCKRKSNVIKHASRSNFNTLTCRGANLFAGKPKIDADGSMLNFSRVKALSMLYIYNSLHRDK